MATNSASGSITDAGTITGGLGRYLRTRAEDSRYLNYDLVPLASQAEVPGNQGAWMTIPHFVNDSTHGVKTLGKATIEALPLASAGATAIQDQFDNLRETEIANNSRQMSYFADGFKVSKANRSMQNVKGQMERIAEFIMKTVAQTQEKLLQNNIIYETGGGTDALTNPASVTGVVWNGLSAPGPSGSDEPIYVPPNPATNPNWGDIVAADVVVANNFALARKYLKQYGTPGFSQLGGKLAAYVGPDTVYRLHTQVVAAPISGVGDAPLSFEQASMQRTRLYRGESVIGDLFGFRLIESNFPITVAGGTAGGPSTGTGADVDCEINVLFGPDAFYVTPHALLRPEIYVTGFNEGGIVNPTKSIASVATDFMFGALRGEDFATKCALMPCPIA